MALTINEQMRVLQILENEYANTIIQPKHNPLSATNLQTIITKIKTNLHGPDSLVGYQLFPTGVKDVDYLILNLLDDDSLFAGCLVNKYTVDLGEQESFWLSKIKTRYEVDLLPYLVHQSAKQVYRKLHDFDVEQLETKEPYDRLEYIITNGLVPLAKKEIYHEIYDERYLIFAAESGNLLMVELLYNFHMGFRYDEDDDERYRTRWYRKAIVKAASKKYSHIVDYLTLAANQGKYWTAAAKLYIKSGQAALLKGLMDKLPENLIKDVEVLLSLCTLAKDSSACVDVLVSKIVNLGALASKYDGSYDLPASLKRKLSIKLKETIRKKRTAYLNPEKKQVKNGKKAYKLVSDDEESDEDDEKSDEDNEEPNSKEAMRAPIAVLHKIRPTLVQPSQAPPKKTKK